MEGDQRSRSNSRSYCNGAINMPDVAVNLQTPIMRSVRAKLKKIQEEHGHETIGETIGWLIEENERLHAEIELSQLDGPT